MRLRVYLFFLAIYALSTAGHIYTIDSFLNYNVTRSLGSEGSLEVAPFMMTVEGRGGKHYSKLGIGPSLVYLPFYWLGELVERTGRGKDAFAAHSKEFAVPHGSRLIKAEPQTLIRVSQREGTRVFFVTLANAFITAAACLVFWLMLKNFGHEDRQAFWATLVVALCTPVWIYARDLFGEPLFMLCLLGSFAAFVSPWEATWQKKIIVGSLCSAVGILARLTFLPIVLILGLYLLASAQELGKGLRRALCYWAGVLPAIGAIAWLNFERFGGVTLTGYHTAFDKGFSIPLAKGLLWNLFSPYRSIFLYAPPAVLALFALRGFALRFKGATLVLLAIVGYIFVVSSKWWAWHGGWCWGPRFLVPTIPLLLLIAFVGWRTTKDWPLGLTIALSVTGFIVQLGAILINYTAIYDYWIKIGKLDWSEVGIESFFPIGLHWRAVGSTSPAAYDLWLIQAAKVTREAWLWGLGWLAVLGFSISGLVRPRQDGSGYNADVRSRPVAGNRAMDSGPVVAGHLPVAEVAPP